MRLLTRTIVLALTLLASTSVAEEKLTPLPTTTLERLAEIEPQQTITICKTNSIPNGYVIIAQIGSTGCPGSVTDPNAWVIKRPGRQELVCKVSPIPSNYVIIREMGETRCPGRVTDPNAHVIRRV